MKLLKLIKMYLNGNCRKARIGIRILFEMIWIRKILYRQCFSTLF